MKRFLFDLILGVLCFFVAVLIPFGLLRSAGRLPSYPLSLGVACASGGCFIASLAASFAVALKHIKKNFRAEREAKENSYAAARSDLTSFMRTMTGRVRRCRAFYVFLSIVCLAGSFFFLTLEGAWFVASLFLFAIPYAAVCGLIRSAGCRYDLPLMSEAEVPELYAILRRAAEKMGVSSSIRLYLSEENEVSVGTHRKRTDLIVGISALQILTEEELENILLHEFAHVAHGETRHTERLYRFRSFTMSMSYSLFGGIFLVTTSWARARFIREYDFYLICIALEAERDADASAKEKGNSVAYISASIKLACFELFQTAPCVRNLFEPEQPDPAFYRNRYVDFLADWARSSDRWLTVCRSRLKDRFPSHPSLPERMAFFGVSEPEIRFPEADPPRPYVALAEEKLNAILIGQISPAYAGLREQEYLEDRREAERFEAMPDEDRQALSAGALTRFGLAYWTLCRYDRSASLLAAALEKDPDRAKALFYRGLGLLKDYDDSGVACVRRAVDLDPRYASEAVPLLEVYLQNRGLERERDELTDWFLNALQRQFDGERTHNLFRRRAKPQPHGLPEPIVSALRREAEAYPGIRRLEAIRLCWPDGYAVVWYGIVVCRRASPGELEKAISGFLRITEDSEERAEVFCNVLNGNDAARGRFKCVKDRVIYQKPKK